MTDLSLNGNFLRNAVLIALAAAGLGWLFYSRAYLPVGEKMGGLLEKAKGESPPPRVIPRKLATAEPMAGYGA